MNTLPSIFARFCGELCKAVAIALQATSKLPDAAGLLALTPDATFDFIKSLCTVDQDLCVVLLIDNAHLLFTGIKPFPAYDEAIKLLNRLEQEIHNLALTLESSGSDAVWSDLKRRLTTTLDPCSVYVPLLAQDGVDQWLRSQFDTFGLHFDAGGARRMFDLTGGHPLLLDSLSRCVARAYNSQTTDKPQCPVVDQPVVDAAAKSKVYASDVNKYSRALARKLDHDCDKKRRTLLYVLAEFNVRDQDQRSANVSDIAGRSMAHSTLRVKDIQQTLDMLKRIEVVTEIAGVNDNHYIFRSFSFARWVYDHGPKIP